MDSGDAPQESGLEPTARRLVHGRLDLAFAADGDGRTYLDRQFASHPFHVCRSLYCDNDRPGLATLYLQSCSGGLYEDDSLDIRIAAHAGAEAHVTTQSSTVVHSMPAGKAFQHADVIAGRGSYLEYLPDPQILFPESRCRSTIKVRLDDSATALVSDSFLAHDPDGAGREFASYFSEITVVDEIEKSLAIDRLNLDGAALHSRRPGIMGTFAAQGTLVVARKGGLPDSANAQLRGLQVRTVEAVIGASTLPNVCGLIVRVLAADGAALRRTMDNVWRTARFALTGALPNDRRK